MLRILVSSKRVLCFQMSTVKLLRISGVRPARTPKLWQKLFLDSKVLVFPLPNRNLNKHKRNLNHIRWSKTSKKDSRCRWKDWLPMAWQRRKPKTCYSLTKCRSKRCRLQMMKTRLRSRGDNIERKENVDKRGYHRWEPRLLFKKVKMHKWDNSMSMLNHAKSHQKWQKQKKN